MMIYSSIRKSKQKLKPKKERDEYQAWLDKHQVGVKTRSRTVEKLDYALTVPAGRTTSKSIPSLNTGLAVATAKAKQVYTGTKMLGIGTLHKSNAVPVFSSEEAQDMAQMRR
jgi:hypothetical protein